MLATSAYLIVFRILHVVAGVAWGGAVFLFVVFVQPSAAALGPGRRPLHAAPWTAEAREQDPGARGVHHRRRDVPVLAQLAADWKPGRLGGDRFGLGLTIGSVAAIVAFLIGLLGTKPGVDRLMALLPQAAAAGGAPPPQLVQEIQRTQARLRVLARTTLAFVTAAVLTMATARYW